MSILSLDGSRESGDSVRTQNINACLSIANIVKSSLGPIGLDKIMVNEVGDVTITNDGATILKLLEVEHPAAKVMVDLARLQESEVGDGTTSVVLFASDLLKQAENLICHNKIHPTIVISGYRMACKEAIRFMNSKLVLKSVEITDKVLMNAVITSIGSKVIGSEPEFFSKLIVDAVRAIKRTDGNVDKYPIQTVNILKTSGKSMLDTKLICGYAINNTVACQNSLKSVHNAKIACFDFNFQKHRMKLGVNIVVDQPKKLDEIRNREFSITKDKIMKVIQSGTNLVATSGGIGDEYMKYFIEANVMIIRRVSKVDLKRLAKVTGATLLTTLSTLDGDESFDTSNLGYAESVIQESVGDEELIIISKPKCKSAASLIVRGPNYMALDEIQRAIEDGMFVVKRALESKKLVCGGGAVEVACSVHLEKYAETIESQENYAISAFAKSLLVIPKQLCLNAALDSLELLSKLRANHHKAQDTEWDTYKYHGLDLQNGKTVNNFVAGVLEPYISKNKMLKFSTEVAMTILRIDAMIKLNPEPKDERH
ncbi:T-complex protein 1 subunit alpha [Intoshia linei]|uniref:T-complex protein 1 subunit alpha n=1 Tax=Intoshia linei TaxID=1819745 RepID=A0A177B2Y7_9BILA|nr:T-complex protein 1 subunit alpha [Intoshia linei]